jgi:CheY-like chemotaxis protein
MENKKLEILVVEDRAENRQAAKEFFDQLGKSSPQNRIKIKKEKMKVYIYDNIYDKLVNYCSQILEKKEKGEIPKNRNPKAFGQLEGNVYKDYIEIKNVDFYTRDLRQVEPFKSQMDKLVSKVRPCPYCISEDRGWVADPKEILRGEIEAKKKGNEILGFFHMHSCPVPGLDMSQVHELDIELSNPYYATLIVDMTSDPPKLRYFRIDENKQVHEYPIVKIHKIHKKRNT